MQKVRWDDCLTCVNTDACAYWKSFVLNFEALRQPALRIPASMVFVPTVVKVMLGFKMRSGCPSSGCCPLAFRSIDFPTFCRWNISFSAQWVDVQCIRVPTDRKGAGGCKRCWENGNVGISLLAIHIPACPCGYPPLLFEFRMHLLGTSLKSSSLFLGKSGRR